MFINKVPNQNEVQIVFNITPMNVPAINSLNLQDIIQIQNGPPLDSVTFTKNADGTVTMSMIYSTDIHNQPLDVVVNPAASNNPLFQLSNPSPSLHLTITPSNNQAAYFYDNFTYTLAGIISKLALAVGILSLLLFFLSMISGKMIGVEMMAVLQITFFSLITLTEMNPCFSSLSYLWLVNGYNSLQNNPLSDPLIPNQVKGIQMFSQFVQNFNFTLALVFIPLLISLISFILSKTAFKSNK